MERYRELKKDMERLEEWRQNHIDVRETFLQTTARLTHRRRQIISEMNLIYPTNQVIIMMMIHYFEKCIFLN